MQENLSKVKVILLGDFIVSSRANSLLYNKLALGKWIGLVPRSPVSPCRLPGSWKPGIPKRELYKWKIHMTLQVKSTDCIRSTECLAHPFLWFRCWFSFTFCLNIIGFWLQLHRHLREIKLLALWLLSLQVTSFWFFRSVKSFISKLVGEADNLPACMGLWPKISSSSWTSCMFA